MKMLLLGTSGRFTAEDWEFLRRVLAPAGGPGALEWLRDDPEALVEALDLAPVLAALVDGPGPLEVSPELYFYVLVRHRFLREGLEEPGLAAYVAGILAERAVVDPHDRLRGVPGGLTRVADFLALLESVSGRVRFHLQVEAGNQFLLLTGIFPEFLRRRAVRSGAPDLEFYEDFGAQAFRRAGDNPHAPDGLARVLGRLGECFREARRSLNRLSSDTLFLGT
jgi:hypothetical protein